MTHHEAVIRGLHAAAHDRADRGVSLFVQDRLLLLLTTKAGKPRYGVKLSTSELRSALGCTPKALYSAIRRLNDKGAGIVRLRTHYPDGEAEYFFAKTEEEARAALEQQMQELRGGVSSLCGKFDALSCDLPALKGEAPMMISGTVFRHALQRALESGMTVGLQALREEEERHALPAASA